MCDQRDIQEIWESKQLKDKEKIEIEIKYDC